MLDCQCFGQLPVLCDLCHASLTLENNMVVTCTSEHMHSLLLRQLCRHIDVYSLQMPRVAPDSIVPGCTDSFMIHFGRDGCKP